MHPSLTPPEKRRLRSVSLAFVTIQGMLFVGYFFLPDLQLFSFPGFIRWVGLFLAGTGLLTGLWAGVRLGRHLSPFPIPTPEAQLVTTGLFRYVRHPIYTALLLFFVGLAVWEGSLLKLLYIPVFVVFFYVKSVFEEKQLVKRFAEYQEYRKKTGRFFPGV